MKKIISIVTFTIIILSVILVNKFTSNNKILEDTSLKDNKMLSMMIEQEDGTYQESFSNSWPQKGYIFNSLKSGCENGGTLVWNEETNTVQLKTTKSDKCYIYFDIKNYEKYCQYSQKEILGCNILKAKDNTLIYHDGKKDYEEEVNSEFEASDLSYRYNGTSFKINSQYSGTYANINNDLIQYKCNNEISTIGEICNGEDAYILAYSPDSSYETYNMALKQALIAGYIEAVVNNKNDGLCSDTDLYRIIGLIPDDNGNYEIKVIKNESIGDKQWNNAADETNKIDGHYTNEWEFATLKEELNGDFYNNLTNEIKNIIVKNHRWETRGYVTNGGISKTIMEHEYGQQTYDFNTPSTVESMNANIGLMYAHDYGFAAIPKFWNSYLYSYTKAINDNWLFLSYLTSSEWTITRGTYFGSNVFDIFKTGLVDQGYSMSYTTNYYAVRPVFFLNPNVKYSSGNGNLLTPYRIIYS